MKEETGYRRREVVPPLVIFDPLRSSSVSCDTTHRSFHSNSGNSGDDDSSHGDGNSGHKRPAKVRLSTDEVSF